MNKCGCTATLAAPAFEFSAYFSNSMSRVLSLPQSQLVQYVALVLTACSFVGRDACCSDVSQFQQSTGNVVAENRDVWQPSNSSTYFDGPALASPDAASSNMALVQDRFESQSISDRAITQDTLRSLMRPKVSFNSEWLTSSDFDLSNYDIRVTVPTYPFFSPPPPMISVGFSYTDLVDADTFGLPDDLYEYSIGLSWVRPIKERWMVRSMLGVALATDNLNTTSDAWQFRGGVFAVYEPNENWQWVFGAIAIGRNDLPVVPAVGVIWQPGPELKIDLTFPKPRIQRLLAENESRQQWGYIGMAIGGGTWAYERADHTDDQLTYGDWRVVAGWESLPTPVAGARFTAGRKLGLEIGYVFSRDLEFSSDSPDISLSDAVTLGIATRF